MRRSLVVGGIILVVALLLVGIPSILTWVSSIHDAPERPEPEMYYPEDSDSGFWPYLSKEKQLSQHSPINLVVRGDSEQVAEVLTETRDRNWNETSEGKREESIVPSDNETYENRTLANETRDEEELANGSLANASGGQLRPVPTQIPWTQTTGAVRYAYIDPGENASYWTTETVQVDDGDYYGRRYHIRMYEAPNSDDEWVAMQAHTEHFDWFTLRHRVDGSRVAQTRVEADLMSAPQIDYQEDVSRVYLANGGGTDFDGWVTIVDVGAATVTPLLFVLGLGGRLRRRADDFLDRYVTSTGRARLADTRRRFTGRHLGLTLTVIALLLGVRVLGIAFERHVDLLSMHAIAALLYPLISLGIPVATYAWASGILHRLDAALAASFALSAAMWIDYGMVGVETVSLDILLQRVLVVVALGLIAAGAARRATRDRLLNGLLVTGVTIWVLTLATTLLGYL
ncbi:MAG: hypothetical protein ACOCR0_02800 [Haloferacaceae archaeon]